MPYKVCPYCENVSYSAADSPTVKWLCPHCEKDVSHVEGQITAPLKKGQHNSK